MSLGRACVRPLSFGFALAASLATPSCSTPNVPPPSSPRSACRNELLGSPANFFNNAQVDIDPAAVCAGGTYVRVHGHGSRRLILQGQAGACSPTAGSPSDPRCPEVPVEIFAEAVATRMRARGARSIQALGLGVCGDPKGDWDAFQYSITLNDWRDVDLAVATIRDELERWDLGSSFGVSIRYSWCKG